MIYDEYADWEDIDLPELKGYTKRTTFTPRGDSITIIEPCEE